MLNNKRKNLNILKGLAVIIIAGIIMFLVTLMNDDDFSLTYVNLMVNPNIELGLNEDDVVVEVMALNEDANVVLHELELEGLDYGEALELVVDELVDLDYINENEVVVSVVGDDEENTEKVREKTINKVRNRLEEKEVYAVITYLEVGQELKEQADELGVTVGHMIAVERASMVLEDVTNEELYEMSIGEIKRKVADERTNDVRSDFDTNEIREERQQAAHERRELAQEREEEASGELPSDENQGESRRPDISTRNLDEVREIDRNTRNVPDRPVSVE